MTTDSYLRPDLTPVEADDFGAILFSRRVAGESERSLCRAYGITLKELRAHVDKHCPAIDRAAARRALGLDLQRLDALFETFYAKALAGDVQCALSY